MQSSASQTQDKDWNMTMTNSAPMNQRIKNSQEVDMKIHQNVRVFAVLVAVVAF